METTKDKQSGSPAAGPPVDSVLRGPAAWSLFAVREALRTSLRTNRQIDPGANRARLVRYGTAVAAVALAFLLASPLQTSARDGAPGLLFLLAAASISASAGGAGPGLLATLLGAIASRYLLHPAVHPLHLTLFVFAGALVSWFAERPSLRDSRSLTRSGSDAAKRRESFLAEANAVFNASLDDSSTLEKVARLAVPLVADWCSVDLMDKEGHIKSLIVVHSDPQRLEQIDAIRRRYPIDLHGPHPVVKALRTGQAELVSEVPDSLVESMASDPEHLQAMRALGMRSGMVVPLVARGRTLGAVAFAYAESGRRYSPEDLAMAEELSRRCALRMDNARLYQESQDVLQRHKESLALLDTLLTAAPVGFAFLDEQIRFVGFNEALAAMHGLIRAEHLGRTLKEVLPDLASSLEPALRRVLITGLPVVDIEVSREASDGQKNHWLTNLYPVRPEGGKTLGIGAVMVDITDRKRSEEALAIHQAHIEALNERLQRAMTETHHRVKNNLQIITAMIDMWLVSEGDTVPVKEVKRLGSQIRTLTAVHNILTQEAKEDGQAHHFSAKAVLETLLPMLQQTAAGRQIRFDIAEVRLSSRQGTSLALVVNELVSNALKYGEGDVSVRLTVEDGAAQLEICDEGPGFPDEFDPGKIASTGLELVENLSRWDLGGQTRYANRPEGGACVTVTIPLEKH